MEELTTFELLSINGGSAQTYESGRAAGAAVRGWIEQFPDAYFYARALVKIVFHV